MKALPPGLNPYGRALVLLATAALGCGVPDVFYTDGGDATAPADAKTDAAIDAGQAGCPSSPPAGATMCCGDVACNGCTAADCEKCTACAADQICCVHSQGVSCHSMGTCP